jgi:two-component system cell cycle sensor histidine kinase/response regulator CckA
MNFKVRLLLISLFFVMLSAVGHSADRKQILILNSYHKGYPWTDGLVKGIEETLTESIKDCEILIEYMDTKRINTDEYKEAFFRLMKMKYTKFKLDIIIVSDDNAFLFAVKYHRDLFGDTPIVFVGVNHFSPSMIDGHEEQITGIVQDADIPATLNTALKLHPNTTQVAVICDATTTGQAYISQVTAVESQFKTLKFIYLDGSELTTSEMLARLRSLPSNSIALLCIWLKDKSGVFVPWERGYPDISKNSPVPLYGILESMLQYGILGGKVQSGKHHGVEAAKIAVKLLAGKKLTDIPVRLESPNTYMFNYKELQRWNISRTVLPRESIIFNEPQSVYHQYKNIFWGIIGTFAFLIAVITALSSNIIRRKSAEENLRESEQNYRLLVENLPGTVFKGYKDWSIEFFDNTIEIFTGYKVDEFNSRRMKWVDIIIEEDIDAAKLSFIQALKTDKSYIREYRIKSNVEGIYWIQERGQIVCNNKGEIEYVNGVFFDVTNRKQAKEALRESEERFKFLAEKMADIIWTVNLDFQTTYVSRSIEKILGFTTEERKRQPLEEMITPGSLKRVQMMFLEELRRDEAGNADPDRSVTIEVEYYRRDGSTVWMENTVKAMRDNSGAIEGLYGVSRDITERKIAEEENTKLQSQLQQVQKMESIGTLAGGIAHDFNNILGIIVGNTELAMDDVPEWNPARHNLEEIRTASMRARDMVKQIMAFSRQSQLEMKPVRISPIIKESLKLLRSSIPTTIKIHLNISSKSDIVRANPTQINQVLINLCTNAAHAMGEKVGVLEVSLEDFELDTDAASHYHDLSSGKYIRLTVSDTGTGIDPKILERIFDPYFTTKEVGKGSGMGLSVVHGIVKSHGGALSVMSGSEKGAIFHILFPCIEDDPEPEVEIPIEMPRGRERILFVDDEKAMVDAIQAMIERLGYKVTARTSSIEALEAFRANPGRFDLVITDFTMPNMSGMELAKELLKLQSSIPIILCTGYSEHINEDRAKASGVRAFLLKPVVLDEIANTIRKVLDND